jgi:uncharacterized protein YndB with AHSA1/START domain
MSKVSVTQFVSRSAEKTWSLVGDPGKLAVWHPAIAQSPCSPDGKSRVCTLADGGEVSEEILHVDAARRSYTYRIVQSPLPLEGYVSTLSVEPADGGCRVTWTSEFEPAGIPAGELEGMIRGLYEAGLGALEASLS